MEGGECPQGSRKRLGFHLQTKQHWKPHTNSGISLCHLFDLFIFFHQVRGCDELSNSVGQEKNRIESPETCNSKQVGTVVCSGTYNFRFHSILGPPCIWESEKNNKIKAGYNKKCDPWGALLSCASVSQISYLMQRALPFPALPRIPLGEGAGAWCETDSSPCKRWGWHLYKETFPGMGCGFLLSPEADFLLPVIGASYRFMAGH